MAMGTMRWRGVVQDVQEPTLDDRACSLTGIPSKAETFGMGHL